MKKMTGPELISEYNLQTMKYQDALAKGDKKEQKRISEYMDKLMMDIDARLDTTR